MLSISIQVISRLFAALQEIGEIGPKINTCFTRVIFPLTKSNIFF